MTSKYIIRNTFPLLTVWVDLHSFTCSSLPNSAFTLATCCHTCRHTTCRTCRPCERTRQEVAKLVTEFSQTGDMCGDKSACSGDLRRMELTCVGDMCGDMWPVWTVPATFSDTSVATSCKCERFHWNTWRATSWATCVATCVARFRQCESTITRDIPIQFDVTAVDGHPSWCQSLVRISVWNLTQKNWRSGATVRWKLLHPSYDRFRLLHPCYRRIYIQTDRCTDRRNCHIIYAL